MLLADCVSSPPFTSKPDRERLESQAIKLLEAATKLLASPSPCLGQRPRPTAAARLAACKSEERKDSKDLFPSAKVRALSVGGDTTVSSQAATKRRNRDLKDSGTPQ